MRYMTVLIIMYCWCCSNCLKKTNRTFFNCWWAKGQVVEVTCNTTLTSDDDVVSDVTVTVRAHVWSVQDRDKQKSGADDWCDVRLMVGTASDSLWSSRVVVHRWAATRHTRVDGERGCVVASDVRSDRGQNDVTRLRIAPASAAVRHPHHCTTSTSFHTHWRRVVMRRCSTFQIQYEQHIPQATTIPHYNNTGIKNRLTSEICTLNVAYRILSYVSYDTNKSTSSPRLTNGLKELQPKAPEAQRGPKLWQKITSPFIHSAQVLPSQRARRQKRSTRFACIFVVPHL